MVANWLSVSDTDQKVPGAILTTDGLNMDHKAPRVRIQTENMKKGPRDTIWKRRAEGVAAASFPPDNKQTHSAPKGRDLGSEFLGVSNYLNACLRAKFLFQIERLNSDQIRPSSFHTARCGWGLKTYGVTKTSGTRGLTCALRHEASIGI
ncbi:hypothetical protein EVAR_57900_1 [Eumeta japonica]|uniref:Uncharacterized protein n=1 Tax=Eumeta variegata TaxID=151549 RepID=A0A4C1YWB9_EUMVA|nr:hypothetical protein EVAR_57900_1 [Eumeta japonica]